MHGVCDGDCRKALDVEGIGIGVDTVNCTTDWNDPTKKGDSGCSGDKTNPCRGAHGQLRFQPLGVTLQPGVLNIQGISLVAARRGRQTL